MASPIHEALESIFAGQELNADAADAAMTQIMSGQATDAQIGAFLAGLRMKGDDLSTFLHAASMGLARMNTRLRSPFPTRKLLMRSVKSWWSAIWQRWRMMISRQPPCAMQPPLALRHVCVSTLC